MALSHCLHLATFCSTESKKRSFRSLQTAIPLSGGADGDPAGCYRGIALAETLKGHIFDILVRFFCLVCVYITAAKNVFFIENPELRDLPLT